MTEMNKESIIADITNDPQIYTTLGPELQKDRDIFLALIKTSPTFYRAIPMELALDREIALEAVQRRIGIISHIKALGLIYDKDLVLDIFKQRGVPIYWFQEFASDPDVVLAAIKSQPTNLLNIDASVLEDPDMADNIFAIALTDNPYMFQWVPFQYKDHKDLVLSLVSRYGQVLEYASYRLRQDREVVEAAVKQDPEAIQYAFSHLV